MNQIDDPYLTAMIAALENKNFKWRTIAGLTKELDCSHPEVLSGLKSLTDAGIVISSTIPSAKGEELYSTAKHFKTFASPIERLGAAFRNRAS